MWESRHPTPLFFASADSKGELLARSEVATLPSLDYGRLPVSDQNRWQVRRSLSASRLTATYRSAQFESVIPIRLQKLASFMA